MSLPNPDELAAYLHKSFPVDDIRTWSVDQLRELAIWNVAVLAEDPACEDVVGLTDEPPECEFPEHGITPDEELDNPYDGSL